MEVSLRTGPDDALAAYKLSFPDERPPGARHSHGVAGGWLTINKAAADLGEVFVGAFSIGVRSHLNRIMDDLSVLLDKHTVRWEWIVTPNFGERDSLGTPLRAERVILCARHSREVVGQGGPGADGSTWQTAGLPRWADECRWCLREAERRDTLEHEAPNPRR